MVWDDCCGGRNSTDAQLDCDLGFGDWISAMSFCSVPVAIVRHFFILFFLLFSGVHCPLDGSCCHRGVLLLLGGVQRQYPRFTRRSSKVLADWCMD